MRLISQKSWENRGLPCYIRTTTTSKSCTTAICSVQLSWATTEFDDWALSYDLQWLSTSCKCLQPAQVASISAVCTKKTILHGSPTEVWTSVCYKGLPFVVNCKLASIASNPGQYSATCRVVLVISRLDRSRSGSYVTASARGHILRHMPLPLGLSLDNYAHALTVDTRPFLFSGSRAWVRG